MRADSTWSGCGSPSAPARTGATGTTRRSPHGQGGPRRGVLPRRLHLRGGSRGIRPLSNEPLPSDLARRPRSTSTASTRLQDGPRPPGGARAVPLGGHLGRPRGGERLHRPIIRAHDPRSSWSGGPTPSRRTGSTCHCGCAVPMGASSSTGGSGTAGSRLQRSRHPAVPLRPGLRRRRRHRPGDQGPGQDDPGRRQERWLLEGWSASRSRWNVLARSLIAITRSTPRTGGEGVWMDTWDGYEGPAAASSTGSVRATEATRCRSQAIGTDLRLGPQAGLHHPDHRPWHRVRRYVDLEQWHKTVYGPCYGPDPCSGEPAHQVLRGRQEGLLPGRAHPPALGHGPALRRAGRRARSGRVHRALLGRRGRPTSAAGAGVIGGGDPGARQLRPSRHQAVSAAPRSRAQPGREQERSRSMPSTR